MGYRVKRIISNSFIKSSGIVFIVNNVNNILNYALILLAVFYLRDDYGKWASTAGILGILSIPSSTFMTVLTHRVSIVNLDNPENLKSYYLGVWKFLNSLRALIFFGVSALYIAILFLLRAEFWWFPILVILSSATTFISSVNQNYLLGLKEIPKYATTNIINTFTKFIGTLIMLSLGFGVSSLPLGLIIGSSSSAVLALLYIKRIFNSQVDMDKSSRLTSTEEDFKSHLIQGSKALFYFIFLGILINIDIILSRTFLTTEQNNQYGIISTFGQIAHFGPVSFSAVIVPFSGGKDHMSIYKMSLLAVIGLSLFVTLIFALFGNWILLGFNKSSYLPLLPLIVIYSIFILFYNICFVSVNYLISRSNYKIIKWLLVITGLYVLTFSIVANINFSNLYNNLFALISTSSAYCIICTIILTRYSFS